MQIAEVSSGTLQTTYRVTVEAADLARAAESELKALGKRVKIPGFRPGNVPLKVLQQRYGKAIQSDVIKNAVTDATEELVKSKSLRLAMEPDVKVEDYKEGGNLVFALSVDLLPTIPALDFAGITLERDVFELPEEEVDSALNRLAARFPNPVPLAEGKKAEEGHLVTMDFVGTADGVAFDGGTAQDFKVEIGSGRLIPGFEDQLIDAKVGDKLTVKVTFPADYFNKTLAGKPAEFAVTVKAIDSLDVPEAGEDFAKARGFADLAALKDALRKQLTREYNSMVRARLKKRLFDALENKCDFPAPPRMEELEFSAIWGRLQREKADGVDVYEGKGEDTVREEYKKIAGRRVKLGLLLADVGEKQKLQITRDELTRALMEHARQFPGQEQQVIDFYRKNPTRLDELRGPLLEEKAVDWVLSKVTMQDKSVSVSDLANIDDSQDAGGASGASGDGASKKPRKKKS